MEDVVYFDFNDFDRCALRLLIGPSHTVIPSGAVADVNQSKAELLPRVTSDRETGSDKQK